MEMNVSDWVRYVGVEDTNIDLFEGQYPVPEGISYNSYLIKDNKTCLMDTADRRVTDRWLFHLDAALGGRKLDYLVVSHMEPDHTGSIAALAQRHPEATLVGNAKTMIMFDQFFCGCFTGQRLEVKEGDTLSLGKHTLRFVMAPMVHWPEVMMSLEQSEGVLFSADAFGRFGPLDSANDWSAEARRYYFNIVGKYGAQVQTVLRKLGACGLNAICPLHGPVLQGDLAGVLSKYIVWSSYEPEENGVYIACASIYGHTMAAAKELQQMLLQRGQKAMLVDLNRTDVSYALDGCFGNRKVVFAAPSYDAGVFPCMEELLSHLKAKNFQKRTIGLIENGTWAPSAGRTMTEALSQMKEIKILEPLVSVRSALNDQSRNALHQLADALCTAE